MYQLTAKIWTNAVTPENWNLAIICPIHKKGDVTVCSNYRELSIICVAHKIFSNILFKRLAPYVEAAIGDYECDYRGGWSTVDQIFTVRQIIGKCSEYSTDTNHLIVDFTAAYDRMNRSSLYAAMKELNTPQKLTALVKTTMNNTQCQVQIQKKLSEPINTKNGVQQGDALACLLFNVALEKVIRYAAVNTTGTIFYESLPILASADDTDIIGKLSYD
jgi:sorting nexin-29